MQVSADRFSDLLAPRGSAHTASIHVISAFIIEPPWIRHGICNFIEVRLKNTASSLTLLQKKGKETPNTNEITTSEVAQ
jgi:hypothetical protein